jgi:hypothetical protein
MSTRKSAAERRAATLFAGRLALERSQSCLGHLRALIHLCLPVELAHEVQDLHHIVSALEHDLLCGMRAMEESLDSA